MSRTRWGIRWLVVGLLVLVPVSGGHAQNGDPADLAFWQAISNSTNPDEYRAYLQAFPNGRFAAIARLRVTAPPGAPAQAQRPGQAPGAATAAAAEPAADADPDAPSLTVTPASGRVGQKFVISLSNFPEVDTRDMIVIVPAGTPVMNPTMSTEQTKVVWTGYPANARMYNNTLRDVGPLAPGRYEVRWMSVLYNNQHTYESKATATLTVR